MRGGASEAVAFRQEDPPAGPGDPEPRSSSPRSPDPTGRQLDGLGGLSSASKVCVIGLPSRPDADEALAGADVDPYHAAPAEDRASLGTFAPRGTHAPEGTHGVPERTPSPGEGMEIMVRGCLAKGPRHFLAAFLALLVLPLAARAADYPGRYVTLVVPLAAGSGTDAVARLVGARLAEVLGVQVVVENRVGANGVIGASYVARAAPDGYTLLIGGTTTHAADPSLMRNVTYDPVADFTPLGQIGVYPYVLFVAGSSPYKSLPEVIAAAKAGPGTLSFAHANALGQLSGELLRRNAGIDVLAVPYRGSPQALTDVIGGRVTMMFVDTLPAVAQIEAGTLRPLAVTTQTRTALLPDVPTLGEIGVGGARVEAWSGLFVPARTPAPIVEKLADALRTTMNDPDLVRRLAAVGFEVQATSARAFGERVAADVAQWRTLTQEIGLEPQ